MGLRGDLGALLGISGSFSEFQKDAPESFKNVLKRGFTNI